MILQSRLKAKDDHPEVQVIKVYGELPLVECYAGQINQVLMNILVNAIDAIEENPNAMLAPTLTIRTERLNSDWVRIAIADNGCGISPAVQQQIFNPFFTTKPVGSGTGMGMAISHQIIVEKHQGKLYFHSTPGQGTEFVIEIPI